MIYRFINFEIDSSRFRLLESGKPLSIEPQAFNVILYLIEHRDRVVTRDELFDNLWPGREVSDGTLSNHIKTARFILGDDGELQKIIRTVRGRGYQFVADIAPESCENEDVELPVNTADSRKPLLLMITTLLLIVVVLIYKYYHLLNQDNIHKSIAVLPFENRSNLTGDVFFTDGIHDDLLTQVSKIRDIKTISRTSVMVYRNTSIDVRTIAKELGVTAILQGGVQRAGNDIRINVQLIDALNDENIWSETYTRPLNAKNIFAIQSEIAKDISLELKMALSPHERERIDKLPTQNLAALEETFRAKQRNNTNTPESYQKSIEHLSRAVELDPQFSFPYVLQASIHLHKIFLLGLPIQQQLEKVRPLILEARNLGDESSLFYSVVARMKSYEKDFSSAKFMYEKAIKINDNNADAYIAAGSFYLWDLGDVTQAIVYLSKAYDLNPKNDNLANNLAAAYIRAGRFVEAEDIVSSVIRRDSNNPDVYSILSDIYFYGYNQIAKSMVPYRRFMELNPNVPWMAQGLAYTYLYAGETEIAMTWFNFALDLAPESEDAEIIRAEIHTLQGDFNHAFDSYLKVSKGSAFFSRAMFDLMKMGLKTGRSIEVLGHFQKVYPDLFSKNVIVDNNNFSAALALGQLLKAQGDLEQSERLLKHSLKVAQVKVYGGWQGRHNNWETRILLVMGRHKEALEIYTQFVQGGFHSAAHIANSEYQVLHHVPEYKEMVKTMQVSLVKERMLLREMEARGELPAPLLLNVGQ